MISTGSCPGRQTAHRPDDCRRRVPSFSDVATSYDLGAGLFQHIAQGLLAPAPAQFGRRAQRIDEFGRRRIRRAHDFDDLAHLLAHRRFVLQQRRLQCVNTARQFRDRLLHRRQRFPYSTLSRIFVPLERLIRHRQEALLIGVERLCCQRLKTVLELRAQIDKRLLARVRGAFEFRQLRRLRLGGGALLLQIGNRAVALALDDFEPVGRNNLIEDIMRRADKRDGDLRTMRAPVVDNDA
jgi:hypothetical protein